LSSYQSAALGLPHQRVRRHGRSGLIDASWGNRGCFRHDSGRGFAGETIAGPFGPAGEPEALDTFQCGGDPYRCACFPRGSPRARASFHAERPIEASVEAVAAARKTTAEILDRLDEEQWARGGTHTESGPYGVEAWLEIYAAHAHDHADQIRRARESALLR
jgi:hypothetical protein